MKPHFIIRSMRENEPAHGLGIEDPFTPTTTKEWIGYIEDERKRFAGLLHDAMIVVGADPNSAYVRMLRKEAKGE